MISGKLWVVGLLAGACTVTPDSIDADTSVVTGPAAAACEPQDAVSFEWAIDMPMTAQVDSVQLACTLGQAVDDEDALSLPLLCMGPEGQPMNVTLTLWATPPPPTSGLGMGEAATLTVSNDGEQAWLRLADADARALVVAASGELLAPPTEASWWSPFVLGPAATSCLADGTACEFRRSGAAVQRSGGMPVVVQDANWAVVGDKGEAQVWIAEAWAQDAGCADGPATWFTAGLITTR